MREGAVRIVRAADARVMPWKNGGGTTSEYAVEPPGAGLDDFAWRFSTAHVASGGPFSSFPGIDRTLLILDGAGLALAIGGAAPREVTPDTPPLPFPADVPTAATLLAGPVLDLNVMTRRALCAHAVRVVDLAGTTTLRPGTGATLVFCRDGGLALPDGGVLASRDLAIVEAGASVAVTARPVARLVVITIAPIG